jgi:hypothetical protein
MAPPELRTATHRAIRLLCPLEFHRICHLVVRLICHLACLLNNRQAPLRLSPLLGQR